MRIEASYYHRENFIGNYDSICTLCFQTVATENTEARLAVLESIHHCIAGPFFRPSKISD